MGIAQVGENLWFEKNIRKLSTSLMLYTQSKQAYLFHLLFPRDRHKGSSRTYGSHQQRT